MVGLRIPQIVSARPGSMLKILSQRRQKNHMAVLCMTPGQAQSSEMFDISRKIMRKTSQNHHETPKNLDVSTIS
jgi:hypothetical protein